MRILDRYILRNTVAIFLGCLFTFFFLYIIIDLFSHLDDILKHGASIAVLQQYYLTYLPLIFVQVSPVACLLATMYTFGRFNRDNEIIAMRAAGLTVFQITRTAILFSGIISVLIFWTSEKLLPPALLVNDKLKVQIESGRTKPQPEEEVINNLSVYGLKNRLYFINKFFVDTSTMQGIIILEQDRDQNVRKKIVANKGVYTDGLWTFYQSVTYEFDENGQMAAEPVFMQEEVMNISETPHDFLKQRQRPELMNTANLNNYIAKLSKSGAVGIAKNFKVDLYQRYAMPFTSIIITLIGIPFSLIMRRKAAGLSSVGLSIILGFLYYVVNAVSIALGKAGILPPFVSAFLSHAIGLCTSLFLIRTIP